MSFPIQLDQKNLKNTTHTPHKIAPSIEAEDDSVSRIAQGSFSKAAAPIIPAKNIAQVSSIRKSSADSKKQAVIIKDASSNPSHSLKELPLKSPISSRGRATRLRKRYPKQAISPEHLPLQGKESRQSIENSSLNQQDLLDFVPKHLTTTTTTTTQTAAHDTPDSSSSSSEEEGKMQNRELLSKRLQLPAAQRSNKDKLTRPRKKQAAEPNNIQSILDKLKPILGDYLLDSVTSLKDRLTQGLANYLENTLLVDTEVLKIYDALFKPMISKWCQQQSEQETSYVSPNPFYVIASLVSCLDQLSKYKTVKTVQKEGQLYVDEHILTKQIAGKKNLIPIARYLDKLDLTHQALINACPIYTAEQWSGSSNRNSVFILRDNQFTPRWVFKLPQNSSDDTDDDAMDYEHFAYKMNFHKQFPIPATYLIKIKEAKGSIQIFIPETIKIHAIPHNQTDSLEKDFQKLLIFDLLFLNPDRNGENLLYQKKGNTYHCYGIDHEASLHPTQNAYILAQLNLMNKIYVNQRFSALPSSIQQLFSDSYCRRYVTILRECFAKKNAYSNNAATQEDREKVYKWILEVGNKLRESDTTIIETAESIGAFFEESFNDPESSYLPD